MRVAFAPDDCLLLVVAGLIYLAATLASALLPPPARGVDAGFPSSESTDNEGAKAAYQLLQELGYKEERWTSSPTNSPRKPTTWFWILAAPLWSTRR